MLLTKFNSNPAFPAPFRFFEEALNDLIQTPAETRPWVPAVDILESENELVVKADLPEVKLEDIAIHLENGILSIKGERKFEHKEKKAGYHRIERSYGTCVITHATASAAAIANNARAIPRASSRASPAPTAPTASTPKYTRIYRIFRFRHMDHGGPPQDEPRHQRQSDGRLVRPRVHLPGDQRIRHACSEEQDIGKHERARAPVPSLHHARSNQGHHQQTQRHQRHAQHRLLHLCHMSCVLPNDSQRRLEKDVQGEPEQAPPGVPALAAQIVKRLRHPSPNRSWNSRG
jgi:hypothetical protein